jgi:acetyl esterase/lipase
VSLDPQIAAQLETLDAGFPPVHTMTGAQARATIRSRFVAPTEPQPVATVRDMTIPGPGGDIPVRVYRPDGDDLPILVYAHGGGFVFCDLDSHDELCRDLANLIPAVVISVGYRLAPEHPWPEDADFDNESYRLFGKGFYNPRPALQWYWDQYVPALADRKHPYASPLQANLTGLPPAVVVMAGHDPLRDEAMAYADALEAAGVVTTRFLVEGGIHGFMTMPTLDIAHQARRQACGELAALLG